MNFKIENNGKEIDCDVVCTFRDGINDRNYVVYTDGTEDEKGDSVIYASRYKEKGSSLILEDIEDDYEWNFVDNMLKVYENGSD